MKKNIVLNGDDDKLSTVKEYNGIRPVFFGTGDNCAVTCENVESRGLKGMSCDICIRGELAEGGEERFHVNIPMPGSSSHWQALWPYSPGDQTGNRKPGACKWPFQYDRDREIYDRR